MSSALPIRDSWNGKRKSVNRVSLLQTSFANSARSSVNFEISPEDAFSYALRVAFLHHLIQPRQKRREFTRNSPRPGHKSTTSVQHLIAEFMPNGQSSLGKSNPSKLPHGFKKPLWERMRGVMQNTESMPGYNEAAVKRFFAELYTKFTDESFVKTIKERKIEPLILIAYSRATEVARNHAAPNDESWRLLPDRHVALFVRLLIRTLKDEGHERDKAELISELGQLEKKLLTNSQDLYMDNSTMSKEVTVPISYDIKDMVYVQHVCQIFHVSSAKAQHEINTHKDEWTEEAAMKDFKQYQQRLNLCAPGTLQSRDFDVEEAFEEWKATEKRDLSSIMMDILTARPDLARISTGPIEASIVPSTPSDDPGSAYSDLALSSDSSGLDGMGFDLSAALNMMSLDEGGNNIRGVDDASYVFTPCNSRNYYKTVLQYAMSTQPFTGGSADKFIPLSKEQSDFLLFLATVWRVPQFTRHVTLLEVAARKYKDEELDLIQVGFVFQYLQDPPRILNRPPPLANYDKSIVDIDSGKWTIHDFAAYRQSLRIIYERGIRELMVIIKQCYKPVPPNPQNVLAILQSCIYDDPAFEPRPTEQAQIQQELEDDLKKGAEGIYKDLVAAKIPPNDETWNFAHVQDLRLAVIATMKRVQKYLNDNIEDGEIESVKPFDILIEYMFPHFEIDAKAIIERVIVNGKARGEEVAIDDGFAMYEQLTKLRSMHKQLLPNVRFAFNVEDLFIMFVQKWLANAEDKIFEIVDGAIQHDDFTVRTSHPDEIAMDTQKHSSSVIDIFTFYNQLLDQVQKLKWHSELQNARFMTSLSRIFSLGIGRYCEMVESAFIKEMEQPSEREAQAAKQSTQDRFLQLAREAISKPKAEVFQFPPKSFVRLNNIEYALQELDKLEKVMNVDACIATIERFEGPPKPPRKGSMTYIFTIKMIEAEDLKACDASGYSDPYIILCDEHRKRLAKSRVISRTLNPRWDESVDITVHSTINVIATIWDHDMFGEHDFVGRAALKLDPQHFKDYLPREFWLDLDTQGRLLLRVSMEAERDDIQFHFGKAFRHLKRTERDMVRRITDKLTVEINDTLSLETLRNVLKTNTGIGAQVVSFWRSQPPAAPVTTQEDIDNALEPLYEYFHENFRIMSQTLTKQTMVSVMARLWKQVLMALESLMVPPLSDKPSDKKPLTEKELDVVYKWRDLMFNFFNAKDEEGVALGVPEDILKSPKYHEFSSLHFFYTEPTQHLIRESERMVAQTAARHRALLANPNRQSAPATLAPAAPSFGSMGTIRRGRSILMSRNLGTMRKAREEKRKEAQADPSDDGILRILRMRPEAAGYLKERSRQRERQESTAATVAMMQQGALGGGFGRVGMLIR